MKKRVGLFCAGMLLCSMFLCAQQAPEGLITAFRKGNAAAIGGYMGHKVELILGNRQAQTDKQGAGKMLEAFFAGNKVNGFQVVHQGSRDESGFIIGTLATSNGHFRVNCFFKRTGNQYIIHQIRIDKSNE